MVSGVVTTVVPPLSQAVGYGVVVGIGALFAVGMIGLTRALKKYLHEDVCILFPLTSPNTKAN